MDLFGNPDPSRHADQTIIGAYERVGRSLDDLPYSDAFEALFELVRAALPEFNHQPPLDARRKLLQRLLNLRKASKLPRLGRAVSQPPAISREEEETLARLVADSLGTLGQRDQLPYTAAFDQLRERFAAATARDIKPHDLWRLIAKLAK